MTAETCSYTLSLAGKAAGSLLLRTTVGERTTDLEARASFGGAFGQVNLNQTSQLTSSFESLRFTEHEEGRGERRSFEVVFDARTGLVRATRRVGAQLERAETPYLRPYSDPLGLLHRLRSAPSTETVRVPMLGKDVVIEPLGESEVETALGPRRAAGYVLLPGPGYVYVDAEAPHTIVQFAQPTEHGLLEAFLTRVQHDSQGAPAPTTEARTPKRRRRGGRKRRRVEP